MCPLALSTIRLMDGPDPRVVAPKEDAPILLLTGSGCTGCLALVLGGAFAVTTSWGASWNDGISGPLPYVYALLSLMGLASAASHTHRSKAARAIPLATIAVAGIVAAGTVVEIARQGQPALIITLCPVLFIALGCGIVVKGRRQTPPPATSSDRRDLDA